ncbi:hypothetical protein Clacol_005575 [Clathrus columnatus]|uniref:Uncharacterized protein n=1 Tax=Clathrus columnatus TaxID=1419009 RepID=A0AAV5ACZ3_9AGAM|nr:hypothetical protein Clacol_005575 [Clathrus columnatus]
MHRKDTPQLKNSSNSPILSDDEMYNIYDNNIDTTPKSPLPDDIDFPSDSPYITDDTMLLKFKAKLPLEYRQEIRIPHHPYMYKINNFFSVRRSGYHKPDMGPVVRIIASAKIGTIYSHTLFDIQPEWLYVPKLPNSPPHDPPTSPTHLKEPSDSPKSDSECLPQKKKAWKKRSALEVCGIEDSGDGSVHMEAEHHRKFRKLR